jgi:hypothetical protein
MMTHIMKTLYKFFKTAEVSQEIIIHQKVKVEKYNLVNIQFKPCILKFIQNLQINSELKN